eukprot:TRINITY_DN3023_c0_g1_i1.p1 TRINITY_DN3023_c0_g1~~TRINITY_DN3023_c0_g1_i1.p1  ORF type:complete len:103 (-),score=31.78 TRINITY_DN3023_c0_g1_i1:209-517(-)
MGTRERLPSDDQEFFRTRTRMLVKPFSGKGNPNHSFPKADTCFFNIMLPEYTSQTVLREKLLFAINNTDSMDADQPQGDDARARSPGSSPLDGSDSDSSDYE